MGWFRLHGQRVLFKVDLKVKLDKTKQNSLVERLQDILGRDHKKQKGPEWGERFAVVTVVGTSLC